MRIAAWHEHYRHFNNGLGGVLASATSAGSLGIMFAFAIVCLLAGFA